MQDIIVGLVQQYGPVGLIIAAAIIGLVWFSENKMSKQSKKVTSSVDKLTEAVLAQNEKLTDTISNTVITAISENNRETQKQMFELINKSINSINKENKEEHYENMQERISVDDEVFNIIKEINDKTRAARTILFEFHNSNENFNGLPFVKYDATSEHIARDNKSLWTTIKDYRFQILYPAIKSLYNNELNIVHYNKQWIRDDLYDLSPTLFAQYNEIGIEDVIYVGCYSKRNKMIGVVAVEFNKKHPYVTGNVQKDEISDSAEQISALLRLRGK